MDFYNATNGPQWWQAKQWLDGNLCTQIWQGVYYDHSGSYITGLYEGRYWFERGEWELMEREQKREGWNDKEGKRNDDGLMKWCHRLLSKDLLSGTLPSLIGALQNITFLYDNCILCKRWRENDMQNRRKGHFWHFFACRDFWYNLLSGTIPSSLGNIKKLFFL